MLLLVVGLSEEVVLIVLLGGVGGVVDVVVIADGVREVPLIGSI